MAKWLSAARRDYQDAAFVARMWRSVVNRSRVACAAVTGYRCAGARAVVISAVIGCGLGAAVSGCRCGRGFGAFANNGWRLNFRR